MWDGSFPAILRKDDGERASPAHCGSIERRSEAIRVSSEHAAGVLGSSAISSVDCWVQHINKCSQRWTKLVEADSG